MPTRQTIWPTRWLMTDERIGAGLWRAILALPDGAGIVFRHHDTPPPEREVLAARVAAIADQRGLALAVAGGAALAKAVGARAVHNPTSGSDGLAVTRSAHSLAEAEAAQAAGAELLFVSPVYPTSSHPGAPGLGLAQALAIARAGGVPAIALGGMDERRGQEAIEAGFHGWAAIKAWLN